MKTEKPYTEAQLRAMMPGTPANVAQTLRAFHGDPKIKKHYLSRVEMHAKADEIIHGKYWEDGKGCAVGCTIHSANHAAYESELGIPRVLAHLEDGIFESLENGESKKWPRRFLSAIEPGADLGMVWPRFSVWLLVDAKWGCIKYARTDSQRKAIQGVADAYQRVIERSDTVEDWFKLRAAADDAAAADADAAAAAAAADAAAADTYAAADAAAAYAHDAADDDDAAAADARRSARLAQSKKLLELLKAVEA
jgi:hypothetical protein